MTQTKNFKDLTTNRSIVLKNKHIGILTKHKIKDLNKFIQQKIEDLDPPETFDVFSTKIGEITKNIKTDIEKVGELDIEEKEDIVKNIF